MAVTGGKNWTDWCTTPLAGQFSIGGDTMERLVAALKKVSRA
jgi:hypothetical protein